ncbi:hypothetical protein A2U01_0056820 [Trifolium medium]|uniref:Uncharacterized protein n=1 Tax=Trifolium medium TaxID=97028 RepID=A0A392RH71_9FABA|nr:hypothetical protein [Trifolium medium]
MSSSSSSLNKGGDNQNLKKNRTHRKPLSHLPFPQILGPKCLRLVEVVNSASGTSRRRKNDKERGSDQVSSIPGADATQLAVPTSGVNYIMGEEALEDVDELLIVRKNQMQSV